MLLECKVSRNDFLRDKNKESRKYPALGLGTRRVYVCPKEVIKPEDLPDKWGLLWVNNKRVYKIVYPKFGGEFKEMCQPYNEAEERRLLITALRHVGSFKKVDKVFFKELIKEK